MKVSLNWIKDYVKINCTPKEYSDKMTMSGTKVEGYEVLGENIQNVVVGKVLSIEKHQDSDHLNICMLDVGKDAPIQIVTGAQNVVKDAVVPVALDGAVLPDGKKIKAGKLRGVESNGMLCSLSELGLSLNDFPYAIEDGIFLLEEECNIGDDIRDVCLLNDVVVDFELTFNRPDCLAFIGIARETAATLGEKLEYTEPKIPETDGELDPSLLKVSVEDSTLCPRYSAAMVKNVKIASSPKWLRARLRAAGVRPINNIVDITNYVMLEYGQPMHAFDYNYITTKEIVVRTATDGEKIVTLDSAEHELKNDMLVITDGKKPIALAGIMGGENSEILDTTTTVVFESANFDRSSVRRTSRALNVRSESSKRFEKGLPAYNTIPALMRALELVKELGAGEIVEGHIDINSANIETKYLPFDYARINDLLGTNISKEEMSKLLASVEMYVEDDKLSIPPYRTDMEKTADIAEEVVRLYGFDNIEATPFTAKASEGMLTKRQKFDTLINTTMTTAGYNEAYTYSFISPRAYGRFKVAHDESKEIRILNPLGEDTSVMRQSGVMSILEVIARNYNKHVESAKVFEQAMTYFKTEDGLSEEKKQLVFAFYGCGDFFDIKGDCEMLLDELAIKDAKLERETEVPYLHTGRAARFVKMKNTLGVFGQIHPTVAEANGLPMDTMVAVFDCDTLYMNVNTEKGYTPLPVYPAITRDLALVCDVDIEAGTVIEKMKATSGKTLESATVFDVYMGKGVEDGKKSVAFRLVLRNKEKTMSDEEADAVVKKILKRLSFELGITIRQ
ncbi:MAG: phenylalanine--tRNA ligase subunit beta [Clostridia bacterium]|nr:phenylalanine--tRNA ligase subunit beta [Clostridia bacterium]